MITGGAGFIGSELSHQAVARGLTVEVVDNLVNGNPDYLADLPADRCRLSVADVRDRDAMRELMAGCDVVYHLACLGVRHSIHSPMDNHDVNATGTIGLLEVARELEVKQLVYTSSAEVYGSACHGPVVEENELAPTNPYGAAKLGAESYVRSFHTCYGLPTVVLRLFNAFGPREHHEGDCGEVIPKFLLRALAGRPLVVFGDGTQTRDFNFVADTARAILEAGLRPAAVGHVINVGSGVETSVNDLARMVIDVVGNPGVEVVHEAARPADIARMCANGTKARDILGYTPEVALADGLRRLNDWYAKEGMTFESLLMDECVHNWVGDEVAATAGRSGAGGRLSPRPAPPARR
ncbi:MAG: GDP-mannose 4,6-dehydratase [Actinobacteria bacterium]|nr:GDP-mannose 4,6-dehydratase [Actinomycetota bacterium]